MTHLPGYENARQVLDTLREIHERLSELYCRLRHGASDPLAGMLLERMEAREKRAIETLDRYEAEAPHKILTTWIQVPYAKDPEEFLDRLEGEVQLDLSPNQIYQIGNKADNFVLDLLFHLEDNCDIEEVKRVFENLKEGEKTENIALSKDLNSLREM